MNKQSVHKLYLEAIAATGSYIEPELLKTNKEVSNNHGQENIDPLVDDPLKEDSTTADVAGFESKFAFAPNTNKATKYSLKNGYTLAKEQTEFTKLASTIHLSEALYNDYKNDESSTPRRKVNESIRKINSHLFQIEQILRQNLKLKQEANITEAHYWDTTKTNLRKISEKLSRVNNTIKHFNS